MDEDVFLNLGNRIGSLNLTQPLIGSSQSNEFYDCENDIQEIISCRFKAKKTKQIHMSFVSLLLCSFIRLCR